VTGPRRASPGPEDRDDAAQWDAVEDASELVLEGRHREALAMLRDVIRRDPGNPYAYHYAGTALYEIGQFEAAADAFRAAVRVEPRYLAARVGLSHALRIGGDARGAHAEARRALGQAPGDADALYALGLAQAAAGQREEAIGSLEAFLEAGPELEVSLEARAMLERLREESGDDREGGPPDAA
jgi:tetratricopeptide (TPR) repeat protein